MAAAGKRTAWLSERDVDFFTGGGPGEAEVPMDPADQATVQVGAGTVWLQRCCWWRVRKSARCSCVVS